MSGRSDFWARRKAAVAAEAEIEVKSQRVESERRQREDLEEKSDSEILEELGLPEPDTLKAGDDFSAFMTKAVPDRIRRRALRLLWRTNPVLANLDELVDYGEDFTDGAMVVENLQTTYQVGKGMLAHIEKLAADAEAEALAAQNDDASDDLEDREVLASLDEQDAEPSQSIEEPVAEFDELEEPTPSRPRRMTFSYESNTA